MLYGYSMALRWTPSNRMSAEERTGLVEGLMNVFEEELASCIREFDRESPLGGPIAIGLVLPLFTGSTDHQLCAMQYMTFLVTGMSAG